MPRANAPLIVAIVEPNPYESPKGIHCESPEVSLQRPRGPSLMQWVVIAFLAILQLAGVFYVAVFGDVFLDMLWKWQ